MHDLVVRDLEQARNRTLGLTDLDDPTLVTQHDPLMSPLVWDLAHVGQQEELWLLRAGDPARPGMLPPAVDALYDAFKHPRAERPSLPLLPPVEDARLEPLLTDGRRVIATCWNDTLSIPRTGSGVFAVASVPYHDDPGWADVPDHHVVDVADGVVTVTELEA